MTMFSIDTVGDHRVKTATISFNLDDDTVIKGLLIDLIRMDYVGGAEQYLVFVSGYNHGFVLKYGTVVVIEHAPEGTEENPFIVGWNGFETRYLQQYVTVINPHGIRETGKLIVYRTSYGIIEHYQKPEIKRINKIHDFDFENGKRMTVSEIVGDVLA